MYTYILEGLRPKLRGIYDQEGKRRYFESQFLKVEIVSENDEEACRLAEEKVIEITEKIKKEITEQKGVIDAEYFTPQYLKKIIKQW